MIIEQKPTLRKTLVTGSPFRVLNLYACLGGNRYKWTDCEVTAVELDLELARMYQERFPNDKVVIADAHQYLLDHYKEFDFIWTSPPCPTHSKSRFWAYGKTMPVYPDMKLYEEIIFLQHHSLENQKWVVENVNGYYEPLIPAQKKGRHLFWSNFKLPNIDKKDITGKMNFDSKHEPLKKFHEIKNFDYKGEQNKLKILRNLVDYEVGLAIFNTARGIINRSNVKNPSLFDDVF
jgi:DNA (cytosine-5)-methyltransferase 1